MKKCPIIFLDIDGVLMTKPQPCVTREWNAQACRNFRELLAELPEAHIVISSSRRCGRNLVQLQEALGTVGICAERVIDRTRELPGQGRGAEIAEWVDAYPGHSYVIFDDNPIHGEVSQRLILIDFRYGLRGCDCRRAVEALV